MASARNEEGQIVAEPGSHKAFDILYFRAVPQFNVASSIHENVHHASPFNAV
jgi:hypothetical protein